VLFLTAVKIKKVLMANMGAAAEKASK